MAVSNSAILAILTGLILYSKKFAYLHVTVGSIPLYITEIGIIIFVSIWIAAVFASKGIIRFPKEQRTLLILWLCWGAVECIRGYGNGIMALRDFALNYYAIFVLIGYEIVRSAKNYGAYVRWFAITVAIGALGELITSAFSIYSAIVPKLNVLAIGYILLLPIVTFNKYQKYERLLIVLASLALILMITSYINRSILLGVAAGMVPLYLYGDHRTRRNILLAIILLVPISIAIAVSGADLSHSGTLAWRLTVWKEVFRNALNSPWIGTGFGVPTVTPEMIPDEATAKHPHNVLLTIFIQQGLVGVAIFIAIGIRYFRDIIDTLSLAKAYLPNMYRFTLSLLGFYVVILVFALANVALEGPFHGIWYWLTIGAGYAVRENARKHTVRIGAN